MDSTARRQSFEGHQLGRYLLRHRLAEGGMATIYLAQAAGARGFERWVVVKVIRPELAENPAFVTMLADEARLVARLHHPNVVSVTDSGDDDGLPYVVMEYLHGESLGTASKRSWTEERSFPAWLVARCVADAARGLHAAHELTDAHGEPLDIVHRDVSPENILIGYDGPAKIIDFGVVAGRGRETKTRQGEVKGKLSHMAPEQLRGAGVDRRADVWSLGVVLWEATLGRRLFRSPTHAETVERVTSGTIPPPSSVTSRYPLELERIVMGALVRDPARRTPTALRLAQQLELYLHGLGRPAGHGEVATWMRTMFSDRLLVREALLASSGDQAVDTTMLSDQEGSGSGLVSGTVTAASFAPPPLDDPTGITAVDTPAAKRQQDAASARTALEEEIDQTTGGMKASASRRRTLSWVLVGLALLIALGFAYQQYLA